MYKDPEKQKQAQRNWVRQKRLEQKGSTCIIDATGKARPIDYEGRCKSHRLLADWADGKGTPYQQALGRLSRQYDIIRGYTGDNLKRYYGL